MTIKIHRILKDDLTKQNSFDVILAGMLNSCSMTIDHYAYSIKQTSATLPYEIEIVSEFVPYIKDVDFAISVRKKIDLTATGVNGKTVQDNGSDIGKYNYLDSVPTRPTSLPPGFQELYKG